MGRDHKVLSGDRVAKLQTEATVRPIDSIQAVSKSRRRIAARAASIILAGGAISLAVPIQQKNADEPPQNPSTRPTTGPARSILDVMGDLDEQGRQLGALLPSIDSLFDPVKRAQIAPKALPLTQKMAGFLDEAIAMAPDQMRLRRARMELAAMMTLLGDADAPLYLRKLAVSSDEEEAVGASSWELVIAFAHADRKPEAQEKTLSELETLAHHFPLDDMIAQAAFLMNQQAANPQIALQAEKIVTDVLRGPMAQRMAFDLVSARKLRELVGKPLPIEGAKVDGSAFTSADLGGKVVLVHFWATWAPASVHQFQHLKQVYDKYHAQGLEIVGISCDTDADDLKAFLSANPGLSWPELFDPKAAAAPRFHPLAEQCSIRTLPMLFAIDRKGVVRSIDAAPDLDHLIPKLLEGKQ